MNITCDKCLSTLDNAQLVRHLMDVHYTLPEKRARREARRIRAEALRARQHAAKLIAALDEALDLFSHEFCYADGRVIEEPDGPSAGAAWVKQARAVLAEVRGTEEQ